MICGACHFYNVFLLASTFSTPLTALCTALLPTATPPSALQLRCTSVHLAPNCTPSTPTAHLHLWHVQVHSTPHCTSVVTQQHLSTTPPQKAINTGAVQHSSQSRSGLGTSNISVVGLQGKPYVYAG